MDFLGQKSGIEASYVRHFRVHLGNFLFPNRPVRDEVVGELSGGWGPRTGSGRGSRVTAPTTSRPGSGGGPCLSVPGTESMPLVFTPTLHQCPGEMEWTSGEARSMSRYRRLTQTPSGATAKWTRSIGRNQTSHNSYACRRTVGVTGLSSNSE